MEFWGLVLAAGKGTRMKSVLPKVLHSVAGRPMLYYPIKALLDQGAAGVIVVLGHGAEEVRSFLESTFPGKIRVAIQREQKGTGHAVQCGLEALENKSAWLAVLYGDMPLVQDQTIAALTSEGYDKTSLSLLSTMCEDPHGYGRMIRSQDNRVVDIREQRDCDTEEEKIKEINPGVYFAPAAFFEKALGTITSHNAQGELLLTDVVKFAASEKGVRDVFWPIEDLGGVNTRADLSKCEALMRRRINMRHAEAGVSFMDLDGAYIHETVTIDEDVFIGNSVVIRGQSRIQSGAYIDTGCVLDDVHVEQGAKLKPYTVAQTSRLGRNTHTGPFSHLRPQSYLEEGARIGNFVEMKKSTLGAHAKANHLSYLGDCTVGEGANIGAGTICCNYDGVNKHQTVIEDGAFIGSDSQLVAPVTIGKNAYVATGTTVTHDVPEDALAIGRSKQQNKEGYAKRLRARFKVEK